MMKDFTRREFIRTGGVTAGCAAGLLMTGRGPTVAGKAHAGGIEFAESNCGNGGNAGKKVLVAYASRCGSTGGVAEAIGRALCDAGFSVDTRLVKHVEDIRPYHAVVLGSAVNRATWLSEATDFAEKNRETLSRMPVAYFLTCVTLYYDTEETRALSRSYMEPALKAVPEIKPVDSGYFAGVLDYSKMGMIYRMVMKSKMKEKGVPEGDFRNWKAISAWAKGLAAPFGKGETHA